MSIEALLAETIDRTFETVLMPGANEYFARFGSYRVRLLFADRRLAEKFVPFVLADQPGQPDLQIGFVTATDANLRNLIPIPETKYRTVASHERFAMWEPGQCPVLYLLDRKS